MESYLELDPQTAPIDDTVLDYFEINGDPFGIVPIESESMAKARRAIKRKRAAGNMVAIVGNVGVGKTKLAATLQADRDISYVDIKLLNQEQITPSLLQREIIKTLRKGTNKKVGQNSGDNYREIAELLYKEQQDKKTVVLLLDDGQQFHNKTLLILKRLRELTYKGQDKLIEIVVMTQYSGLQKITSIEEIGRRFVTISLNGFNRLEVIEYIKRTVSKYFDCELTRLEWCNRCGDTRPLVIQNMFWQTLERAMIRGGENIQMQDVESGLSLVDAIKQSDISYSDIGKDAGDLSKALVSQVLNGKYTGSSETINRVRGVAIEKLVNENSRNQESKSIKSA